MIGVLGLWVAILRRDVEFSRRPRNRAVLVACLLLGVAASMRWLWVMAHLEPRSGPLTWAAWLCLLLGPIAVAARYVWTLTFLAQPPAGEPGR